MQRKRRRYTFFEDGYYIFDTYNGELYDIDFERWWNEDIDIIIKGIVRRKSNHTKKVEKLDLDDWRGY